MAAKKEKELEVGTLKWVKLDAADKKSHQVVTASEVATDYGVPRIVLMDYLRKEVEESAACWGLPFTLLLVLSYAIVALTHDNASVLRSVEESMDHDILDNANFAFVGPSMGNKGFDDVNSPADFWSFVANGLVPLLFVQEKSWHEGYDESDPWYGNHSEQEDQSRGVWLSYNRIVGGVRMRQERSKNQECKSVKDLLPVYGMPCVGGHGYELDPEIRPARFTANAEREVWLYTYDSLAHLQSQVWEWERTRWFDRNTKKIEIAIPAYNGEQGIHVMIYVNFFMSRGGHIWKKLMPLGFAAQMHPYWYYWIGDFTWMFCVLYIFLCECAEIWFVFRKHGIGGIYAEYVSFWNAFDWFSLACAFTVMGMFGAVMNMLNGLNDSLEGLKDPDAKGFNSTAYVEALDEHVLILENTVKYVNTFRMVMAAYPLIIILRLFKAYSAQPRLAMVTKTLETASQELVEFFLVFFSVFITITISGVVLFGREVGSFTTLPRAFFACFRMLFGDLLWDETSKVGRVFAFTWIALFMIVNVMLLLNMLLAIIMKHYVQAKDQAGNAQTLWSEAYQVYERWRDERHGKTVPIEKILWVLEHEEKQEELRKALSEEEEAHIETDEEIEMNALGKVTTIEDLVGLYAQHLPDAVVIPEEQAHVLIAQSVEEYYGQNHSAIDMDEVLKLTHKVEYRTQKLNKMSKILDKKNPCPNEIAAFSNFLKDIETFTDEMRSECDSHRREVQELRTLKRGLLLQLQTRQSLIAGLASDEHDPTSVNSLLAHGDYTHYAWRLGARYSDDPQSDGRGVGEYDDVDAPVDFEHSGLPSALDGGPTGPLTGMTQTKQPRYQMEDPVSDDELAELDNEP